MPLTRKTLNVGDLLKTSLQGLRDDPAILKVQRGRAQTRALSTRKDYAFGVETVDAAIEAARRFYAKGS